MTTKKNPSPRFVIGMDGGGTKTHAVIADMGGTIVAEHHGGASNFQIIGIDRAARTIHGLMTLCCESAGCSMSDIACLALGLTGAGRTGDQQRMRDGMKKLLAAKKVRLKHIVVESDARIALEGAFKGKPGIILIGGTGSIAFGKDSNGAVHRVGGWGRVLGDEGSGYFLGLQGLSAVTHHLDGRGDATVLTRWVAERFALTDQTTIIEAVYRSNFDLAAVAPLVLEAAEHNDVICRMIVERAVIELAAHVRVMTRKLEAGHPTGAGVELDCALIGGLLANDTLLSRALAQYIVVNFPHVRIIPPMSSPAFGAVIMGLQHLSRSIQ
jgi:N-acetylglucosamine kinase-like BadF-type ATPase